MAILAKNRILENSLGRSLRDARKSLRLTQHRLAELAHIPRLAVLRAEAGDGQYKSFAKLVSALDHIIDGRNLRQGDHLGERLRLLRIERGLSQQETAALARITRPTVAAIERGAFGHLAAVQYLGDALGAGLAVRRNGSKAFWTGTAASSLNQKWTTPPDFLDRLYGVVGGAFDLDPCSPRKDGPVNARLRFTEKDNGLVLPWPAGTVFCNPPYGREIGKWVAKCLAESERRSGAIIALITGRVDTKWLHSNIARRADVIALQGRLAFGDGSSAAPFPSILAIWNGTPELISRFQAEFPNDWLIPRSST